MLPVLNKFNQSQQVSEPSPWRRVRVWLPDHPVLPVQAVRNNILGSRSSSGLQGFANFLLQRNKKLFYLMPELVDLLLAAWTSHRLINRTVWLKVLHHQLLDITHAQPDTGQHLSCTCPADLFVRLQSTWGTQLQGCLRWHMWHEYSVYGSPGLAMYWTSMLERIGWQHLTLTHIFWTSQALFTTLKLIHSLQKQTLTLLVS
eukprot:1158325-Pelagomonas_calceolata.AAC.2